MSRSLHRRPLLAIPLAALLSGNTARAEGDFGHSASGLDAAKWAPRLRTFMAGLEKRS